MCSKQEISHFKRDTKHRFAAHILMFDVEPFILRAIDNCAPHVEKIYIAYSDKPWIYNVQARENFINPTGLSLLEKSPWLHKIEIIKGNWEREEDQRNACLDKAVKDGIDFLIIHDADEFYTAGNYKANIETIDNNNEYQCFKTPMCSFWKNTSWIIESKGSQIVGSPEFAINCGAGVRFTRARINSAQSVMMLDGLCYHLSFVRSDQDMLTKLSTWGHSHQLDRQKWYIEKWLHWYPEKKNLHPVSPSAWERAAPFTGELPASLLNFTYGSFSEHSPSVREKIFDKSVTIRNKLYFFLIPQDKDQIKACVKEKLIRLGLFTPGKFFFHAVKNSKRSLVTAINKFRGRLHRLHTALLWKKIYTQKIASLPTIRLHLGCGSNRITGMINCEFRATGAADIVMDCSNLSRFPTDSVDLVFSHAFFEHLHFEQRLSLLCDCRRILKRGGRLLFLGLPDLKVVAQSYLDNTELTLKRDFDANMVYRYTHGAPEISQAWWLEQLHKTLFDRSVVDQLLQDSGFERFCVFNYRYIGENIPLNMGFLAWHGGDASVDLLRELAPYNDKIWDVQDCISNVHLYNCKLL